MPFGNCMDPTKTAVLFELFVVVDDKNKESMRQFVNCQTDVSYARQSGLNKCFSCVKRR